MSDYNDWQKHQDPDWRPPTQQSGVSGDGRPTCTVCGEPMPEGEEIFNYHGYSGPCPKPPLKDTDAQVFDDQGVVRNEIEKIISELPFVDALEMLVYLVFRRERAAYNAGLAAAEGAITPNVDYQYVQEDDWKVCNSCDSVIGDGSDYADKCPCYYRNQERDAARQQIRAMRRGKPE